MNELQEFIDKQSDLALQSAKAIASLTEVVNQLAERVVQLETDMKNVLENTGSIKGGK